MVLEGAESRALKMLSLRYILSPYDKGTENADSALFLLVSMFSLPTSSPQHCCTLSFKKSAA